MSCTSTKSSNTTSSSEDDHNTDELRRGPWTMEEDTVLVHYIACHGEGRWNLLAKRSGLRRTGKSCRLRWLNYLKPDVKRGNLTPEEQLLILDLHSKWGNRWSKIAQYLPGRTDNEIKNYWRTRVQKQAKNLKINAESAAFQDIVRRFWIPRLIQKIELSSTGPIMQNQALPLHFGGSENSSQAQRDNSQLQRPLDVANLGRNSGSESTNVSRVSQFAGYDPNSPFEENGKNGQISNTNDTFLEGCSYDMDLFGPTSVSEGPIGGCHVEGADWPDNDLFASMWNMDELWQHKS